jgi:hypothetical protein
VYEYCQCQLEHAIQGEDNSMLHVTSAHAIQGEDNSMLHVTSAHAIQGEVNSMPHVASACSSASKSHIFYIFGSRVNEAEFFKEREYVDPVSCGGRLYSISSLSVLYVLSCDYSDRLQYRQKAHYSFTIHIFKVATFQFGMANNFCIFSKMKYTSRGRQNNGNLEKIQGVSKNVPVRLL